MMIDPALLRDRFNDVQRALQDRGVDLTDELTALGLLDAERRELIPALENQRRLRKQRSERIGAAKRKGEDASALLADAPSSADEIARLETRLDALEAERRERLLRVPNLPHASVPRGATAAQNVEVRRRGDPPVFDFEPQPHWDLGPALDIIDFERAAKIAGARFSILKGAGARLSRALINFMLDLQVGEHGYTEIALPYLANEATLTSTGHLPKFAADLFKVEGDWTLYLIPTAEVPLTSLHRDEILDGSRLPLRYAAYTACFRSEAGSYGRDVRGMIRQHQFDKVELVKITTPEQSYDELESLTANAEEVLSRLGLAYRTVALCTGDLGFAASKTYDIEVWLPSQKEYKEISSCSNTEAFQARRANLKFRPAGGGKAELAHTLNGSGLAVGRTIVAILENCQRRDGAVVIPAALRPYMGGIEVIEPRR